MLLTTMSLDVQPPGDWLKAQPKSCEVLLRLTNNFSASLYDKALIGPSLPEP